MININTSIDTIFNNNNIINVIESNPDTTVVKSKPIYGVLDVCLEIIKYVEIKYPIANTTKKINAAKEYELCDS